MTAPQLLNLVGHSPLVFLDVPLPHPHSGFWWSCCRTVGDPSLARRVPE